MKNNLIEYQEKTFEDIKHIDKYGNEFWLARELQLALGYKEWRLFSAIIEKAQIACSQSENAISSNFGVYPKIVKTGVSEKQIIDYKLSRYACYLIVQNANPKFKTVALGQTYFAIQTRRMELTEKEYDNLSEDDKRIYQRNLTKKNNYSLNITAAKTGVRNFDKFHNAGYKGLYNGETADDIAKRKGLRYREDILDNMGSEELADNLFRIVQTEAKLKRDNISNENDANNVHYNIGKDIREFISKQGGTMPEELPTPTKSIKTIEREKKKLN